MPEAIPVRTRSTTPRFSADEAARKSKPFSSEGSSRYRVAKWAFARVTRPVVMSMTARANGVRRSISARSPRLKSPRDWVNLVLLVGGITRGGWL